MLDRLRKLSPAKRLKVLSISVVVIGSILFLTTLTSLSLTASNLMITTELSTTSELQTLYSQHALYIISQRMIVAFDVLLLAAIPLLLFSVFKFYTKGNLIIIGLVSLIAIGTWTSGIMFLGGESELRQQWGNLWETLQGGRGSLCSVESCGDGMANYVICGKLQLWSQTKSYLLSYTIIALPLFIGLLLLAYWTNRLDLRIVEFSESSPTD